MMGTKGVMDKFMEGWDQVGVKVGVMVKSEELWDREYLEQGYPL